MLNSKLHLTHDSLIFLFN